MQQQYNISFFDGDVSTNHFIIQHDDRFEAFYFKKCIGVFHSFMDAANAVLQIAALEAWTPPIEQRIFNH